MPWRVLFVSEIFSKFVVSLGSAPDDDIFYESVFAVLNRKCGSFHKRGRTNSTHFLCSYVAMHNLCIYPYYPSVGHCSVCFGQVFPQPST